VGINPLFDERAEEIVLRDLPGLSESPEKVPDRLQKPDRVYGLRETDTFEGLLEQVAKESATKDYHSRLDQNQPVQGHGTAIVVSIPDT